MSNSINRAGPQDSLTLFLGGDVMTGRGIDQVLPHSVDPRIYERYTESAKQYVQLAEQKNGSIPDEASYSYIWGEALDVLNRKNPDVGIINLETAVTTNENYLERKGIHYRMHPKNIPLLTEASIDVCIIGNNHSLDWGYEGLKETLDSLRESGLKTAGAGLDKVSAVEPAVVETKGGRLLVFSYASPSAGIPMTWSAGDDRPGVNVLPHLNTENAENVASHIRRYRQKNDRVVLSLHWGNNWGYEIPSSQQEFARRIIDEEVVDIIHGHSSHHPKGIEVYNGRLILYGCGDLINDYEGIGGHERYRGDLSLIYFPQLNSDGELRSLAMAPMQIRRFQLQRAPEEAREWIREILDRECNQFGHAVEQSSDGYLELRWQ
jgi:poly-gamma-glutamate synthesis protein (capsule biosynthesis protein)